MRARLSETRFGYRHDLPTAEYREQVLEWLKILAADGFGALGVAEEHGGIGDQRAFMAAFETLAYHDLSLTIKFGVQFGLFQGVSNSSARNGTTTPSFRVPPLVNSSVASQ